MSTHLTRMMSPSAGLLVAAALTLTACDRAAAPKTQSSGAAPANAQLSWARAALERNPQLEVVATDPQTGVVTVKDRETGEVETVKASELAAVSPSQLKAMTVQPEPEPEPGPAQQEQSASSQETAQASARDGGEGSPPVPGSTPSGYKIERAGGQIRVSGPGVSIVSSGSNAAADDRSGAARRAADPFICEGRRTLQLDNRDIYVDGDAITVRDGCELFLTNSHIVASGTGIVVQNATVHISNSHVEGGSASFQADDRAKVYVRGSTFQGVPRRGELAMVQDQGGNRWR